MMTFTYGVCPSTRPCSTPWEHNTSSRIKILEFHNQHRSLILQPPVARTNMDEVGKEVCQPEDRDEETNDTVEISLQDCSHILTCPALSFRTWFA
jgi:hypothetical protein